MNVALIAQLFVRPAVVMYLRITPWQIDGFDITAYRERLLALQQEAARVYVDPTLIEYAVRLVTATRQPKEHGLPELASYIMFGASPRASINLILAGRALAFVRGRNYVLPPDVQDVVLDVLRHRIGLSYEALSDNVQSDELLKKILTRIPTPEVPLHERALPRRNA